MSSSGGHQDYVPALDWAGLREWTVQAQLWEHDNGRPFELPRADLVILQSITQGAEVPVEEEEPEPRSNRQPMNPITRIQEYCQTRYKRPPNYEETIVQIEKQPYFRAVCVLPDGRYPNPRNSLDERRVQSFKTKKEAKRHAAHLACQALIGETDSDSASYSGSV